MNVTLQAYRVLFEQEGNTEGFSGLELRRVSARQVETPNQLKGLGAVRWEVVLELVTGKEKAYSIDAIENQPQWITKPDPSEGAKLCAKDIGAIIQAAQTSGGSTVLDFTTNPGYLTVYDGATPYKIPLLT